MDGADAVFNSRSYAELYQRSRLSYPDEVFDRIFAFWQSPKRCSDKEKGICLGLFFCLRCCFKQFFSCFIFSDLGCGSGQATVQIARKYGHRFSKIIGIDSSASQIKNAVNVFDAEAKPLIEYKVASAEQTGMVDSSVDLVLMATSLHWSAFYSTHYSLFDPRWSSVFVVFPLVVGCLTIRFLQSCDVFFVREVL